MVVPCSPAALLYLHKLETTKACTWRAQINVEIILWFCTKLMLVASEISSKMASVVMASVTTSKYADYSKTPIHFFECTVHNYNYNSSLVIIFIQLSSRNDMI